MRTEVFTKKEWQEEEKRIGGETVKGHAQWSTREWGKKRDIYEEILFSFKKEKRILSFCDQWVNLEDIVLNERLQMEKRQILHGITYM